MEGCLQKTTKHTHTKFVSLLFRCRPLFRGDYRPQPSHRCVRQQETVTDLFLFAYTECSQPGWSSYVTQQPKITQLMKFLLRAHRSSFFQVAKINFFIGRSSGSSQQVERLSASDGTRQRNEQHMHESITDTSVVSVIFWNT